jgi:Tfp pilus assembly protein PilX
MIAMNACSSSRQRGAAALFVVVMLCFAMVLVAALAQRNIVVEEQRSANELRSRIAFAAADAGLEWALARINDPTPIGATCLPSADPAATSFRARVLRIDAASGAVTPTTWNDAGSALPLQAACIRGSAGWTCSCPTNGRPTLPAVDGGALAPAFFVELAASSRPGVVRAVATGCTKAAVASGCAPADAGGREATARVEIAWALLPALRSAPVAALTVAGDLDVGAASLGVANVDAASGGLAVHAGGRVVATALRIDAPPGAPLGGSIAAGDDELRALGADRLFARHFGMPPRVWAAQPAGRHVVCGDDCTAAIAAAVAGGARLLFVDGDAALTGPAVLGSADDPLALVASGALTIVGDVAIHGVVHAASLDWRDGATGFAFVHGALVVGGDVRGNASADIVRDAAILDRLAYASGSFVRVDGSWKDF